MNAELEALQARLGHVWSRPELFETALSHSSWAHATNNRSNEVLELLGDSVLDLLVAEHLMVANPTKNEGFVSQQREKVVCTCALAAASRRLGIPENIKVANKCEYLRDVARVAAGTLEAIIAAAYLDGGLAAAETVVERTGLL